MRIRPIATFALSFALAIPALAQTAASTDMEILRQKVKADKKLVISVNLSLTDAEAKAFWPVYDAYQNDLKPINERLAKMVLDYADAWNKGPISDATAKKLLDEALAIDAAETKLKSSSMPKILAALPAAKAARYYQIESKIRAAIHYELAAGIPLIE